MKIHYDTSVFKYLKPLPTSFLLLLFLSISSYAQVSGTVFKDFNANGTKENTPTYNEVGMVGVVVNATNPAGAALTVAYTGGGTSTNTTGVYTVTGGTAAQIRLEFVMPDSYTFASSGASGGTTVMFPSGATQDLAVNYPGDYSQPNPEMAVSCYVAGTLGGTAAAEPAYVKFNYNGYDKYVVQAGYIPPTKIATHSQLGAVSGAAYSRIAKKIYTAAVLRRHVVFGPQGIGGIYEIDPTANTVTNWLNIETLAGVDAGTDTRNQADPANSIPADPGDNSYDYGAFALVGKQSLGDVDISDDGAVLYVTNLFQQSVVAINANTKALIGSYSITASALGLSFPQSDLRPWGLKYYKGKLYVGVVCSAESSQAAANLKGYVLEFDPSNPAGGFSIFYTLNLNYIRELGSPGPWKPWHQNAFDPGSNSTTDDSYNPQPILSDIEFDVDGSMILGFLDRHTIMFSSSNLPPDPTASSSASTVPFPAGDILRVCKTNTGFALEGTSGCAYNFPYSDGGEFYNDKRQLGEGNGNIKETAGGALALLPGYGQIVSTAMDEYDVNENGIAWWNNTTGVRDKAYMIYDGNVDVTQGKASGLGDIELLSDAAPIEIGNRVWEDTDADGVQDAGEPALGGVTVTLCDVAGTPIPGATATTDGNGNYYFSTATGTNTASAIYGLNLSFGTAYILKFPTTNGTKSLTGKDLGGNDLVDSDAGTDGKIAFTTGYAGENNHSFDVGYSTATCTKPTVGTAVATQATCTGSTANSDAKIDVTGISGGDKYSFGTDSTTFTYASATAFTGAAINITALANPAAAATYYIRVYNAAEDCFKTVSAVLNPKSCTVTCIKPNAGTDQAPVCIGNTAITTATLAATVVSGGAWTPVGTNPAGAIITNPNSATSGVTGLTPGVYKFIWATSVTCSDTVKIVIPNCQAVPPCTPDVFAYWNFEDCSQGSNTPNDGMTPATTNFSGCSALTVSELTRIASGNSCQVRSNGTTAVCMGSSTNLTFEDNSDKAIMFSLTYPAGSTGKLSSISFESMAPKFVDFNNSGDTTNINNYPTRWGIRVLKNNVEIFRLIDQPLSLNSFTVNNLDWSTNPDFDISGATTFKFEILGYLPSNVAGAGIREIWDLDEVKVYGYCGNCSCVKPNAGLDAAVCQPINTAKLTAVTAGGTWVPIGSLANPSAATIDANGNITGMTAAGTYKFVYSVTAGVQTCTDTAQVVVNSKPNAGGDQSICSPITVATLTGTPAGGTWSAMASNPATASVTNAGAVTNMTVSGTYKFIYMLNGCTDTVAVVRKAAITTVNLGPGTICQNESLTYTDADGTNGTWSGPGVSDNGMGASLSAKAALTQLNKPAPATFYIYYSQTVDGCSRTDSGQVTINPRPAVSISGPTTACSNGLPINFTANPAGGTFSLPNGLPAGAVTVSNNVATLNAGFNITSLTFSYKYTDAATGCDSTASHSITVTSKPNAGIDQTLACANPSANTLTTSTTLLPSPAGGTWTQIGTTPATATIAGNNVTNMTVAGTYQFVYSLNGCSDTVAVTVQPCSGCVKPNAGPDAAAVCQPTATAKLTAVTAGGTWAPIGSPANPSAATIDVNGNITGLSTAGTYKFVYSVTAGGQTCTDTAQVVVNAKPTIGDGTATICAGESVDLTTKITNYASLLSPVWTVATAGGTAVATPKSVSPSAMTTYVLVAQNAEGCKDTARVAVTVNPKPTIAVANGFPACRVNGTAYTIKFAATGGSVTTVPSLTVTGDSIANIPLTTASVKLIITSPEGCKDSITVTAPVCNQPVGSIGDLIWKDADDNGLQDLPTEKGVAGVKVNLYAAAGGTKTGAVLQTKTTGADGLYLFNNLMAGDYIVEIDKTTLPDTCQITAKQNIPSDDTKDSDFNPTTGLSQVITLNPVFNPSTPTQQSATNNLTVDAGLTVPCVKSKVTVTAAPVCSADVQTYSLNFSVSNKVGTVKVDKGVLTGNNPYTVTGIPSGATVKITDSLSAVCKFDTLITGPNCNCTPPLPTLVTPSLTVCIGDTFPTIKATVVGKATVEWFSQASGGSPIFTGLNFKPTGVVTSDTVFYAQARSTDATCPMAVSTSRVMATINAQNCIVEVDLALRKSINSKIAQIGDELTYTIKVFNQLNVAATGVEVTDSIATTVQFVAGSFTASRGSAGISGNVITWTIGSIAANAGADGDTVTLTYKVKATQEGIHFNTAEISKTKEKDIDSTPGNGKVGEDDIESQCFTVPIKLCPGEKAEANVPAFLTNVQWFKNGGTTPVASGNTVLLSEIGTYTFTATNQTCPAIGCCPIIIEPGVNCCPEDLCIPFTIKKRKK